MEEEQPEWATVPEDEYDALNDETFGGVGGDDAEYTWENSQTLFQELHPTSPAVGHSNSSSNGFSAKVQPTPLPLTNVNNTPSRETEYYDYENDNALEESISRLVLDDLEDTEDEEEARKMKLSRLGVTSNFNTYFTPPQVASKHLHWLMDKELPGGSSLLGSSVWSMHPTSTPEVVSSTIGNYPSEPAITPSRPIVKPQAVSNSTPQLPGHLQSNHVSSEDAFDGENNISRIFGNAPTMIPSVDSTSTTKKPVFKTVEELERELLHDDRNKAFQQPVQNPPQNLNHSKSKVLTAEDLERELFDEAPLPQPVQKPQDLDNRVRSPLRNLIHGNQKVFNQQQQGDPAVLHHENLQVQHQQQPPQKHAYHVLGHPNSPNLNVGPPGMGNAGPTHPVNNFFLMEQQKLLLARQGLIPGPPHHSVLHHGMFPPGPLPSQLAQSFHPGLSPIAQHNMRMLQLNPHLRARLPLMMVPPVLPQMRHIPPQQIGFPPHPQMVGGYRKFTKTDDRYHGLMNEKDKQRLRNIQIIQLQNDHPFTTDYYSLMHKAKQAVPSGLQLLIKLYPKRDDENVQKRLYEPARFENCLGKLQAVSALAPKRVIDTFIRVTESRNTSKGGLKAYRYLLLEIEKLYECLLIMEECDIRMSILCNADDKDLDRRSQTAKKLAKVLTNNEKFLSVLAVPKGKMLICRALPLIDTSLRYTVLGHLMDIFPLWENDDMDKAFPYLRHCILHAELKDLLKIIDSVTDCQIFESVVISRLGVSILSCIFHQAESILLRSDPLDDLENHWIRHTRTTIFALLMKKDEIAKPLELFLEVRQHIKRFGLCREDAHMMDCVIQGWENSNIPTR